jgi:hypothetical protein
MNINTNADTPIITDVVTDTDTVWITIGKKNDRENTMDKLRISSASESLRHLKKICRDNNLDYKKYNLKLVIEFVKQYKRERYTDKFFERQISDNNYNRSYIDDAYFAITGKSDKLPHDTTYYNADISFRSESFKFESTQSKHILMIVYLIIKNGAKLGIIKKADKKILYDSLVLNIGSCVEDNGSIVCYIGKAQRLLLTLQGYIDGINITIGRVNTECATIIKNIRLRIDQHVQYGINYSSPIKIIFTDLTVDSRYDLKEIIYYFKQIIREWKCYINSAYNDYDTKTKIYLNAELKKLRKEYLNFIMSAEIIDGSNNDYTEIDTSYIIDLYLAIPDILPNIDPNKLLRIEPNILIDNLCEKKLIYLNQIEIYSLQIEQIQIKISNWSTNTELLFGKYDGDNFFMIKNYYNNNIKLRIRYLDIIIACNDELVDDLRDFKRELQNRKTVNIKYKSEKNLLKQFVVVLSYYERKNISNRKKITRTTNNARNNVKAMSKFIASYIEGNASRVDCILIKFLYDGDASDLEIFIDDFVEQTDRFIKYYVDSDTNVTDFYIPDSGLLLEIISEYNILIVTNTDFTIKTINELIKYISEEDYSYLELRKNIKQVIAHKLKLKLNRLKNMFNDKIKIINNVYTPNINIINYATELQEEINSYLKYLDHLEKYVHDYRCYLSRIKEFIPKISKF